ncbi:hypothetical protein PPL_09876 [Heterostelium album PN500]|uniref:Uncharacterized protein n=1 Tax=Heterostelium pallidum (strain ATCC 26659 / Pp 5 / PN500) TaxID=670386 RepID=D3BPB1_HETP5|nr:hypothetical protein PPL_09876 [Heterostelium album PN500]EFA77121.1 hypothetical protein PPL_09876 [Heterostelium album PN500]|eukprot:XP_020429250.1 hypothetical protein PPL_09876 [Heterostelium album PN500]
MKNTANDQYLEVRANNVDEQSMSVHSRYYLLETPFSRNYIDFDELIVNCPSMRSFNIKNISKSKLTINLSTSLPDEIKLYKENIGDLSAIPTQHQLTKQSLVHDYITKFFDGEEIDPLGSKTYSNRKVGNSHQNTSNASSATNSRTNSRASSPTLEVQLDKQLHIYEDSLDSDVNSTSLQLDSASSYGTPNMSNFALSQLVPSFEDNTLPLFTDFESETNYIQSQIEKYKRLEIIVQSGQLVAAKNIELAQNEEITIYIVFIVLDSKRPWLGGKLKNMEAKLFIGLDKLDDKPLIGTPTRELNISTKVCKSMMDLAQRNINFGNIIQYDYRTKTLLIHNLTQVPLVYRIKKSGSITSGNLNIANVDRMGIIRPFRKREVQFVFKPTFSGIFDEKLIIENIYDSNNNQIVHIKANVKKPRHFFLNTLDIDFGVCMIKGKSITKRITVTNTSNQKRIFKIIDDSPSSFESCLNKLFFKLEERSAMSVSKETEVEIDALERKLKICRRKGQHEKALKINMQIEKLRNSGNPSVAAVPVSRATSPAIESEVADGSVLSPMHSISGNGEIGGGNVEKVDASLLNNSAPPKPAAKIGDSSITFEVDGGGIQNILVYFAPIPKPGRRQWYGKEDGIGSILVYESKNSDVTKKINYNATICFDEETYRQNISQAQLADDAGVGGHHQAGSGSIKSPISNVMTSPTTSPKSSTIITSTATLIKPTAKLAAQPTVMTISPPKLDLGEVRVYEDIVFRFTLANHTGHRVNYDLSLMVPSTSSTSGGNSVKCPITLKEKQGVIEPYGRRTLEAVCQPQVPGKQTHTILVKSSNYEGTIQVSLSPRPPQYVLFPDLPSSQILDFGDCYYDKSKKFSKTSSFRLDNLSHKSLYISVKSNLSMQIFVFQDEKFTKPADNIFLKGYEKTVVYICLQPSMTSENYIDGHCRELVGGIRIKVHDTEHSMLYENTIKFTAIVGKSIIRVGKTLIDLGSTSNLGEVVSGSFNISNLTTLLPLKYTMTPSKNLKLSKTEGTLDGAEVSHGLSKERIYFTLHTNVYGLYEEKVTIANLSCPGQKLEVNIRLLVDDASLLTNLPLNSNSCDILKLEDVYVAPVQSAVILEEARRTTDFIISQGYTKTGTQYTLLNPFTMRNYLKYDIRIYPKCNINIMLFLHEPSIEELPTSNVNNVAADKRRSMRLCGKPFVLTNDQKIIVYPHPPEPESLLTPKKKSLLWKGRKVQFQGTLVFERSDTTHYPIGPGEGKTHISKLVTINGSYCMSLGALTEESVDIGRIGYENSWKEVVIMIEVQNLSEIPLHIRALPLPSKSIKFTNLSALSGSSMLSAPPSAANSTTNSTDMLLKRDQQVVSPGINSSTSISGSGGLQSNLINASTGSSSSSSIFDQDGYFEINESESRQISISLDPKKIEQQTAGPLTLPILFENIYNHNNPLKFNINLHHTLRVISFGRLVEGEFVLPNIHHPPIPGTSSQADEWFTIENTSNKVLKINVDIDLLPNIQELITVEVVHKSSNAPIPSFSLRPSELIEVRLRAKPRPDSRLKEQFDQISPFGKICINTNLYPVEVIPIRGTIVAGQTFSLSVAKLNFNSMARITNTDGTEEQILQSSLTDYFKIRNLSTHFPMKFAVEPIFVGGASNFPANIKISPADGEIQPNESLPIDINVELPNEDMPPSSTFQVQVTALDTFNKETQKLAVNILGGNKPISSPTVNSSQVSSSTPTSSSSSSSTTSTDPSTPHVTTQSLSTQVSSPLTLPQTQINTQLPPYQLQQQQQQSQSQSQSTPPQQTTPQPNLPQRISLKGCTPIPKSKNCYEINLNQQEYTTGNVQWEITLENISAGKSVEYYIFTTKQSDEQWLGMSRNSGKIEAHGRHNITLTFSTKRMDMYSAYLIVENKNNPSDQKTIHITMDVVAKQNTHYKVWVDGRQEDSPSINLGDVFYNTTYTDRSFIIANTSSMPLDFILTTSLLPTDCTEVCFSLSRSYLRSFNTLYVAANSSVKVYIFFHPSFATVTDDQNVVQKDIKIFVNCRLIRDFQTVINLQATCRHPQIRLSDYNTVFIGRVSMKDSSTVVAQQQTSPNTFSPLENSLESSSSTAIPSESNAIVSATSTSTSSKIKKSFEASSSLLLTSTSSSLKSSAVSGNVNPSIKKSVVDIDFESESRDISIYNNFAQADLHYCVRSNLMFFIVDCVESGIISAGESTTISIHPNIQAILENSNLLLKEKYFEEHIIVYNRNRLSEKHVISLRITIGNLTAFSTSSGLKGGYHYRNLEYIITKFNRKFKKFWFRVLSIQQQAAATAAAAAAANSASGNVTTSPTTTAAEQQQTNTTNTTTISSPPNDSTNEDIKSIEKLKELIEIGSKNERYPQMVFDLQHITNELILFGLKKQVGQLTSHLASLFYCNLFKQNIFKLTSSEAKITALKSTAIVQCCINSLGEFLSYFPEKREDLLELRNLQDQISKTNSTTILNNEDDDTSDDDSNTN